MSRPAILVTGGAGFIGSHTLVELAASGHQVVVIDNFCNSQPEALRRVEQITGKQFKLYQGDVADKQLLEKIFNEQKIGAVIHFAGLKSVGQSVAEPLTYYQNNLGSTLALLEVMKASNVKRLIFSSSATVYGTPAELPLKETAQVGVGLTNPYGWTKFMIEQILRDTAQADPDWQITSLRYFNPIGAHESGLIGEDPNDIPNNLMPYVTQVATGKLKQLNVFGDDYDTPDGSGVRDYIHVVDLARGHLAALDHLKTGEMAVYNLGTGQGVSVLELVKTFEQTTGQKIPYQIVDRRPGDVAACYADVSKANEQLGWQTTKSLADACRDSWRWQSENPDGFKS